MSTPASIHAFLGEARVPYTVVPHQTAFTAQEEAAAMHVPGRDWAKVVICVADQKPIQAVLPAPLVVNLDRLSALAGASSIRFALEHELRVIGARNVPDELAGHRACLRQVVHGERVMRQSGGHHDREQQDADSPRDPR